MRQTWLPRLLFRLTVAAATGLVALVLLAPRLGPGSGPVLDLFARDPAVRRTALASAAGLVATASIFFRPPNGRPAVRRYRKRKSLPQPPAGAGA
jgi:hypothetical protein